MCFLRIGVDVINITVVNFGLRRASRVADFIRPPAGRKVGHCIRVRSKAIVAESQQSPIKGCGCLGRRGTFVENDVATRIIEKMAI